MLTKIKLQQMSTWIMTTCKLLHFWNCTIKKKKLLHDENIKYSPAHLAFFQTLWSLFIYNLSSCYHSLVMAHCREGIQKSRNEEMSTHSRTLCHFTIPLTGIKLFLNIFLHCTNDMSYHTCACVCACACVHVFTGNQNPTFCLMHSEVWA